MPFDESKMKIISETNIGPLDGWKGDVVVVRYQYGDNQESIKVVTRGKKKDGSTYESRLWGGVPVAAALWIAHEVIKISK